MRKHLHRQHAARVSSTPREGGRFLLDPSNALILLFTLRVQKCLSLSFPSHYRRIHAPTWPHTYRSTIALPIFMTEANRDLEKTFDSIQGRIMIERRRERRAKRKERKKWKKGTRKSRPRTIRSNVLLHHVSCVRRRTTAWPIFTPFPTRLRTSLRREFITRDCL